MTKKQEDNPVVSNLDSTTLDSRSMRFVDSCIKRWGADPMQDERCNGFRAGFANWIDSLPNYARKEAFIHMSCFKYFTHQASNDCLRELHELISSENYYDSQTCVFSYIRRGDGALNSSFHLLSEYMLINDIPSEYGVLDYSTIVNHISNIKTIVFVDDFCGTGNTFCKLIEEQFECLSEQTRIIYAVICSMRQGKKVIEEYAKQRGLAIDVVSIHNQRELYGTERKDRKDVICDCAKELGISKEYALGYKESQSLVAFYENTPNNTFGYIWGNPKTESSCQTYKPIFPRKKRCNPGWRSMRQGKKNRRQQQYISKCSPEE